MIKNNYIFIYAILILFLFSCNLNVKKKPFDIISNYLAKTSKYNSLDCNINYKIKLFSEKDTINYKLHCTLIKKKYDTIFGGIVWISNDSVERYYDLQNIYVINHKKKLITRFFPLLGQKWAITGHLEGNAINIYFLKSNLLRDYIKDSTIFCTENDTLFLNKKYHKIKMLFKDSPPLLNQTKYILFNKKNKLISKILFSVNFQFENQYNEWNLSDIKFGTISEKELKEKFDSLTSKYLTKDFKKEKYSQTLKNKITAPQFEGWLFDSNKKIKLSDYKNKIVLLDFWYKDCYPCIKSIPILNELNKKYSTKGLVILGLNPVNNKKDREKILQLIETNEIKYSLVLINKDIARYSYKINSFPTIYIIDKKGKIVYSSIGNKDSDFQKLDSVIHVLLQ